MPDALSQFLFHQHRVTGSWRGKDVDLNGLHLHMIPTKLAETPGHDGGGSINDVPQLLA